MRNANELQKVIALQQNNVCITEQDIVSMLQNVSGVTLAGIVMCTEQALAAAHKKAGEVIYKINFVNAQLFNNIKNDIYGNAVKRSATGDAANIEAFETQSTWYEHTGCHSIVKHKVSGEAYLYCFVNACDTYFMHNGNIVDRNYVAQYCTKSEAAKLLQPSAPAYNATHDIEHDVTVRVFKLANIVAINAKQQTLKV